MTVLRSRKHEFWKTSVALTTLPTDVLILILRHLPTQDLVHLSMACRLLNSVVMEFGWTVWLHDNPRPSYSLSSARGIWTAHEQVRYHSISDRGWARADFVARPLSRPWLGRFRPPLAISPSRLVVAAGNKLYSYTFRLPRKDSKVPGVHLECVYLVDIGLPGLSPDITGVAFLPDGEDYRTLCVSFSNGMLLRVSLPPPKPGEMTRPVASITSLDYNIGSFIENISSTGNLLLSVSSTGTAALLDPYSLSHPPHVIELKERSWTTYVSSSSSGPYAAFGTSSKNPLHVHPILDSELSESPSAVLGPGPRSRAGQSLRLSAVYGICGAPPSFPWGSSPQIIVSGWYDGFVRVHDLRSSARSASSPSPPSSSLTRSSSTTPTPLLPVLALNDPWSLEPIYAVASGGGASAHIAAGSARHSVVSFWDVRAPRLGWSIHAPGSDPSPVYSVVLESSRLFGATQSRPFVYDFGPGVTKDTYPVLPSHTGLKRSASPDSVGYYVTKYSFGRKGLSGASWRPGRSAGVHRQVASLTE